MAENSGQRPGPVSGAGSGRPSPGLPGHGPGNARGLDREASRQGRRGMSRAATRASALLKALVPAVLVLAVLALAGPVPGPLDEAWANGSGSQQPAGQSGAKTGTPESATGKSAARKAPARKASARRAQAGKTSPGKAAGREAGGRKSPDKGTAARKSAAKARERKTGAQNATIPDDAAQAGGQNATAILLDAASGPVIAVPPLPPGTAIQLPESDPFWNSGHMPRDGLLAWPARRTLPQVAFSHARHVADRRASCSSCHHDRDRAGCSAAPECHAVIAPLMRPETLYFAFHAPGADHSCLGCHERLTRNYLPAGPRDCKGCHRG